MNFIKIIMKKRTRVCMAGILALMMTVSVLPAAVFAVDAPTGTTSVISYTGFDTAADINDKSETKWDGNGGRETKHGQLDGNGVLVIDTTVSNGYLTAKFDSEKANMEAGDKLVILGRVRLDSGSGNVRIALLQNPNSAGGLGTKQILTWVNKDKVTYGDGEKTSAVELTSYSPGKWVDAATVITAGEGNTSATAVTYVDGVQKGDTPHTVADWSIVNHIGLVRQGASSVAYFDDVEAFIIPNGANVSTLNYSGVKTATIAQYGNIELQFDSPIIEGTLEGKIEINGTAVEKERLSLSGDRRSVIIAPPEGGSYPVGTRQLSVSIDAGIESYTGAVYSGGGSGTVTVERDDAARRSSVIDYNDFESGLGSWGRNNSTEKPVQTTLDGNGVLKFERESSGTSALTNSFDAANAKDGQKLIILGRMRLDSGSQLKFGLTTPNPNGGGVYTAQNLMYLNGSATLTYSGDSGPRYDVIGFGNWVDTATIITFAKEEEGDLTATAELYAEGQKWGGDEPQTVNLNSSQGIADELALVLQNPGLGYFDDVEAYVVTPGVDGGMLPLNLAETPLTDVGGNVITEVEENNSFVLNFDQPIIEGIAATAVKVNGQSVSTSLTANRRGIIVSAPFEGWSVGSTLNISVSDLQGYGTEAFSTTNENLSLTVTAAEKPETKGTIVSIVDYQSFDDNDIQAYTWARKDSNISGGKLASSEDATKINTIKTDDYNKIKETIQTSSSPTYVVIRAKMQLNEAVGTNGPSMTMGLAKDSGNLLGQSNVMQLVSLAPTTGGNGTISFNTNGGATANENVSTTLGQEEDITIVMSFENQAVTNGQITYYHNGVKAASGTTKLDDSAQCIRLVIQRVDGSFDDVEMYCITGGRNKFEFDEIADETEVDPMSGVQVRFSSDLVKEKLLSTNALSGFMVGDEQIPASRISVSPDGNGVIIAPPVGGWDSQKTYTIKSTAGIRDILGTPIDEAVNATFKTGGDMLTACVLSSKRLGSTATASLKLRNANTEGKNLMVIMAEYTGQEDFPMMVQANSEYVTMAADETNNSVSVSLDNLTTGSTVRVFVWEWGNDNINPVLDMPYTVK